VAKTKRHPGTIEARGDSLRVILYAGGERHTFTLPTTDRREAAEFAQRKHIELQQAVGRVRRGLPGRIPLSALLDKFEAERLPHLAANTQKTYKLSLATFCRFFAERLGDPPVSEVRPGNVADYSRGAASTRVASARHRSARGPCRRTGLASMPCSHLPRSWSSGKGIRSIR
jgi:hypothetical protein